jgi:LPS sulfotransferase NodH
MPPAAYILCATPRSGSTLLCEMLAATGLAGRPNSFFRTQDIPYWAAAWGVPPSLDPESADFDRAYLAAMLREGAAGTGVFGLRLMHESLPEASRRLDRALGHPRDVAQQFEAAFGPTLFIHLSRRDKLAQAVSRVRAEQSGVWHQANDGAVLESTGPSQPFRYDPARIATLLADLERDDRAWTDFFAARRIAPLRLVYEEVSQDPRAALAAILSALHLDPAAAERTPVRTARLADATSALWTRRFLSDHP